jgi:hypothetical protein
VAQLAHIDTSLSSWITLVTIENPMISSLSLELVLPPPLNDFLLQINCPVAWYAVASLKMAGINELASLPKGAGRWRR